MDNEGASRRFGHMVSYAAGVLTPGTQHRTTTEPRLRNFGNKLGYWPSANWQFVSWRSVSENHKTLAFPCNSPLPYTHIKPKHCFEEKVIWSRKMIFFSIRRSRSSLEKMTTFSCLQWHCNLFQTFSSLEVRPSPANIFNVKWAYLEQRTDKK